MKEIWKKISSYEDYKISNMGRVLSFKSKKPRLLKFRVSKDGYFSVVLYKNNRPKSFRISRLVACAFLKNPFNKKEVNHIDGNKSNNKVSNLEWCTRSENMYHAYKVGLKTMEKNPMLGKKHSKATKDRISKALSGEKSPKFIGYYHTPFGVFKTSREAAKVIGVSHQTVQRRSKSRNFPEYYLLQEK